MASAEEPSEPNREHNIPRCRKSGAVSRDILTRGYNKGGAAGTRDILILVSSESGGEDIVARKKGELNLLDKDRLTIEGISEDCWEDDAMIMEEKYSKNDYVISIVIEDTPHIKKQSVLDKISTLFNNTTQKGVLLHYIGPGRRGTGDWCFSDGFISFTDIADLYMQHFTGRVLTINSDCSYSGQWVESCKEFLDSQGVQPCGHSARKTGIMMKMLCSCQSDEIGSSLLYSVRGNGFDKKTGKSYVKPSRSVIGPDQSTSQIDFTGITCKKTLEDECALVPDFTFQKKKKAGRTFLVRGLDKGQPAWHYIVLEDDPEAIRRFKEKITEGIQTSDLAEYGMVMTSGLGQDPPQSVKDWVARVTLGLESCPHY